MKVSFLGLGVMGAPMAGHLAARGVDLSVWNRTSAKADAFVSAHNARTASSPADAARGAGAVITCLGDDPDIEAVLRQVLPVAGADALIIDHSTASPDLARRLAAAFAEKGARFIDAPVSGGEAGAKAGKLAVMCGGEAAAVERARSIIDAYSSRIVHVGPSGHGQLAKAVNQICIAGLLQGLSEGVHFAKAAGLDIDRVLEAVSGGAARSWQMENRAKTMAEGAFDFGFAVDWMRKDLRIALAESRKNGAQLPVTALVDQFYAEVQAMGGGRNDTSSLIRRLKAPEKKR